MDAVIGQGDTRAAHLDETDEAIEVDAIDLLPDYDDDEITLVLPSRPPPPPAESIA
jgi:hypothetical protein